MECCWCNGTGKFKEPYNSQKYEEVFDKYDSMGVFNMEECRDKALEYTGYKIVKCPLCNMQV